MNWYKELGVHNQEQDIFCLRWQEMSLSFPGCGPGKLRYFQKRLRETSGTGILMCPYLFYEKFDVFRMLMHYSIRHSFISENYTEVLFITQCITLGIQKHFY